MGLPRGPGALPVPAAVLIVLDGWGLAPAGPGNAVSLARTPVFDGLWSTYPHNTLRADGRRVGLPAGAGGRPRRPPRAGRLFAGGWGPHPPKPPGAGTAAASGCPRARWATP